MELGTRAGIARGCYDSLASGHGARDEPVLIVAVRIAPDGAFTDARLAKDDIGDPARAECALSRFKAPLSAAPEGGCVDLQIPIRLTQIEKSKPGTPAPPR